MYCPNDSVTRDEMAIFIIRVRLGLALAGSNPTFTYPATPYFTDVPTTDFAFPWVQRMKQENITSGCTATMYCASDPVIRGDMAIFIMRGAFNQLLPAGTPVLTQISPATLPAGASGTYTITGANTSFVQGTTTLSPIPGVTIGTITVTSPTTLTVQLTAAANAVAQPYSILAITGTEEDVLSNGLTVQSSISSGYSIAILQEMGRMVFPVMAGRRPVQLSTPHPALRSIRRAICISAISTPASARSTRRAASSLRLPAQVFAAMRETAVRR